MTSQIKFRWFLLWKDSKPNGATNNGYSWSYKKEENDFVVKIPGKQDPVEIDDTFAEMFP